VTALTSTVLPVVAAILGSALAAWRGPGEKLLSALQHLAAGVVFGAAATEILPQVLHQASPIATLLGGGLGVILMLTLKAMQGEKQSSRALLAAIGIDFLIDGLVLGLAFVAGARAGMLLTIALTLEILFLGLALTAELGEHYSSKAKILGIVTLLSLLLPLGTLLAIPVAGLSPKIISGFLSFGLMALLYLVTEELLVEAHEKPDTPIITAMFFVGFLGLLTIEELGG
jgi:ZIP family zinc transporter